MIMVRSLRNKISGLDVLWRSVYDILTSEKYLWTALLAPQTRLGMSLVLKGLDYLFLNLKTKGRPRGTKNIPMSRVQERYFIVLSLLPLLILKWDIFPVLQMILEAIVISFQMYRICGDMRIEYSKEWLLVSLYSVLSPYREEDVPPAKEEGREERSGS